MHLINRFFEPQRVENSILDLSQWINASKELTIQHINSSIDNTKLFQKKTASSNMR